MIVLILVSAIAALCAVALLQRIGSYAGKHR
jgi:hypothetical protein